ncbi:hypothetical protein ZEAMMB73_Zm00001d052620 [Zea mays]|uniref:Uncharacterized protein n=1 Tax=Zea mays TaxID=4577 RepID=A0A1D6QI21_MAIZE|nr:hypothetical protein ZEAMMB73_Zm00001d052620 [Zea mays]
MLTAFIEILYYCLVGVTVRGSQRGSILCYVISA